MTTKLEPFVPPAFKLCKRTNTCINPTEPSQYNLTCCAFLLHLLLRRRGVLSFFSRIRAVQTPGHGLSQPELQGCRRRRTGKGPIRGGEARDQQWAKRSDTHRALDNRPHHVAWEITKKKRNRLRKDGKNFFRAGSKKDSFLSLSQNTLSVPAHLSSSDSFSFFSFDRQQWLIILYLLGGFGKRAASHFHLHLRPPAQWTSLLSRF